MLTSEVSYIKLKGKVHVVAKYFYPRFFFLNKYLNKNQTKQMFSSVLHNSLSCEPTMLFIIIYTVYEK